MHAIQFTARDHVTLIERPDPEPGPGEVVIAIAASGLCHTDYEVLRANYGAGAFPVVPGHEYAGTVIAIGTDVSTRAVGDRVVVDPNLNCSACPACARGWAHLCEDLGAYGVTRDGGFATHGVVRAEAVHPIGDIPFGRAALAEPMGCVLNGVEAVHAPWMETALIFGAGPMGILMGMALRARGIERITFVDVDPARIAFADSFGFGAVGAGSNPLAAWDGRADLVVDATGVPSVAAGLTGYARNGGRVLFFGVCPSDARIEISPFEVFRRQLTLAGSHSLNHNIPAAIRAIGACGADIDRVVSHRLSLDAAAAILRDRPPHGSLKVQAVFD